MAEEGIDNSNSTQSWAKSSWIWFGKIVVSALNIPKNKQLPYNTHSLLILLFNLLRKLYKILAVNIIMHDNSRLIETKYLKSLSQLMLFIHNFPKAIMSPVSSALLSEVTEQANPSPKRSFTRTRIHWLFVSQRQHDFWLLSTSYTYPCNFLFSGFISAIPIETNIY